MGFVDVYRMILGWWSNTGASATTILTPCVSAAALYQPGAIGLVNQPGAREATAYLPGTNSEMGC